jgi:hypothetical protein
MPCWQLFITADKEQISIGTAAIHPADLNMIILSFYYFIIQGDTQCLRNEAHEFHEISTNFCLMITEGVFYGEQRNVPVVKVIYLLRNW